MAVKDFKKFFKRRGRFVRQPRNDKKSFQRSHDDKNSKVDRKCFKCRDSNHFIGECLKPSKEKNQRAFFRGSWSDSGEEDDENICLGVDLEPNEWIKDSGCSKHMTGNRKLFSSYKAYNGGNVIFGSNLCGNIIGKGQICDNKCRVTFSEHDSGITKDGKVIGYSQNSKAYIILNQHTKKVRESLNMTFDETHPPSKTSPLVDDDLDEEKAIKVTEKKNIENDIKDETLEIDEIVSINESRNHPLENVIVVYADSDHAGDYVDRKSTSGTMTVNEYCTKIRSMVDRLKNLGCDVSDKNLVMYTVNGLDSRFAILVDIIRHRETLPSFETTRNMLLLKESSFKDDTRTSSTFDGSSSSPTALVTSTSSTPKENSETKEEDAKDDESSHKERYTFKDDDDDREFDDLD
uniref:Hybrid signal transduction histidine kinase M n=1 Tax=Tanacetum cinerariifolium TaxID=118510 RepID=A0A6L2LRR3_TANCI|nr:hybrid signal transduction histidine kinase M [Tanacetum cinerariifolium]